MKRILFVVVAVLCTLFFFTGSTGPPQMAMTNSAIFATAPQVGIGSANLVTLATIPALNDQIFTARPYGLVTNAVPHTDLYNKALVNTVVTRPYPLRT